MKKSLFTLALLVLSATSFAADTATINLTGSVAATVDLQIKGSASNVIDETVDILGGTSNKNIGTAIETSNNLGGYKVSVQSQNAGLKHVTESDNYHYTFIYGGNSTVINSTSSQVVSTVSSVTGKTSVERDMLIDLAAKPNALSGNYADTLTLTIAAN